MKVVELQNEVLHLQAGIIRQLRNDDLESVAQMVQLVKDRLFMIDALAEAVVNLESVVLRDQNQ